MISHSQPEHRQYRPDIDGLRAIAIISVIAYHAGFSGFSGGFVGVDIFFVISGFLITSLLFKEASATGRINLGAFYARRVRRLMPAGLVVVAVTLVLGAIFLPPASSEQSSLARTAIAFAYFGSNFYFFKKTGGYFDEPSFGMPLLHTWSLAVEEQYYLIWPMIMLLVFHFSGAQHAEGFMRRRSLWVLGVMFAASLALSVGTTRDHQSFAFFLLPTRIWEFAIGGMVGLAGSAFYVRLRRWAEVLAVGGMALIVYSVVVLDHSTPFPGWAAIFPVLGSALLIAGMTADEDGIVRRMLALKPMVFIGLLSYSWYLWHWPLLSLFRIYNLGVQDVAANALIIVLALVLAWLTYVLVENPIRVRRPGPFRSVRPTLFVGLGIALATVSMGSGLKAWRDYQKTLEGNQAVVKARKDLAPYWDECLLGVKRQYSGLPSGECIHGAENGHPKVLLWGDSHAAHLMPALMEVYPDVAVYQLTMAGCPPVRGYELQVPMASKDCPDFNQRVLQEIPELKKSGLQGVVISARWQMYLRQRSIAVSENQGTAFSDPHKLAQAREAMQMSFDETLTSLERAGVRVLVLPPNPETIYSPPHCIGLGRGAHCNVPREVSEAFVRDATTALAEVVARHPNTRLAQLMDFFCNAETCYVMHNGTILYTDENHISATAARDLGRFLAPDLAWLLGKPSVTTE
jgi:peptidoglycan/LPS O-acetylase OafA/YrhL/lysophospholipase L1-like esterase